MCMVRKIYAALALMNIYVLTLSSQTSDRDSIKESMNMDAVYDRPFLTFDKFPVNQNKEISRKILKSQIITMNYAA